MPLPDVAKAVKGRRILNTTTLNKKNNTKLTACAKKNRRHTWLLLGVVRDAVTQCYEGCSGQRILNTIIFNHKENSAKFSGCAKKIAGVVAPAGVPCHRARSPCWVYGGHDSLIVYSLLRGGFSSPAPPDRRARRGDFWHLPLGRDM